MRVLIGEISSYKAIVIARYIRSAYPEAELWAYDNKAMTGWLHTRYIKHCVQLPFKSLDAYIEALAVYVRDNDIDVLLPVHSDYIGAILQRKNLFGHALDWVGQYSDYIRLHEKDQLMGIAASLGIRVPKNYTSIAEAEVPFVVKPTNLSSAKGVQYYFEENDKENTLRDINKKDESELTDISSNNLDPKSAQKQAFGQPSAQPCSISLTDSSEKNSQKSSKNFVAGSNYIIQEYIAGQGCGYEVYCRNGEILTEYGHIRLAEWPISGGSSVLRGRYIHPDMRPMAEKILSAVPWTGFAMFEFKLTSSGELVLIEVNPRIWGSINQPLQDGCALFEHILGKGERLANSGEGVRTSLVPQVWLAMIGYLFRGQSSRVRDWLRHWGSTRRDVSFWSDPFGLISMIIRKIV